MWELTVAWWEPVVRGVVIYSVLFVLIRLLGKKQIGQPSPFDFILLLIISEGVSNALTADDHSIIHAIIMAVTLISLNYIMDHIAFRYPAAEKLLEGEEQVLIRDGKIIEAVRQKQEITYKEIEGTIREHGLYGLEDVAVGVLENNGKISILPRRGRQGDFHHPQDPEPPSL